MSATKDGVEQDLSSLVIAGMPSDATIIVDGAECKEASFWMFHPKTGDLLWDFAWVVP
ncbi:MAG: hypothetical protein HY902_14950 [Deltaproteobacteria bacterium]|nr:hypothetical protein [Deltaproteobacteria bacterium]